ncbi:hypothetical protein TNCV_4989841 [Trichonephila clavipes]|uniref:TIL domain-containing protein n=1 Tax=Trichonephila clavipes TaxID=2585209 RepID=A0A8X7BHG1_TRICX|nr:hypothetical protein TNCV_4989841 [Trichonephila clavipes]
MSDNGGKIQWLKFFLQALLFLSISARIFAEESGSFIFVSTEPKAPECPPNERWTACLSNCTNCEERGICLVTDCDKGRCECYRNFVRLYPDGPCERVSKCPVNKCGENEVWRECGPVCEWCGTLRCRELDCSYKCYCKEGYLRNDDGKCIPENECPNNSVNFQFGLGSEGSWAGPPKNQKRFFLERKHRPDAETMEQPPERFLLISNKIILFVELAHFSFGQPLCISGVATYVD